MRGAVIYAPGDVRIDQRAEPTIIDPTDAVVRITATGLPRHQPFLITERE